MTLTKQEIYDQTMKFFDECCDWELYAEDANDTECRNFCTINDIERFAKDYAENFKFTAVKIDHTGATIRISAKGKCEATPKEIAEKMVEYYTGLIHWDNDGYGGREPYVLIGSDSDCAYEWLEENNLNELKFEVHGKASIVSEGKKSVKVRVDFEIPEVIAE